MALIKCPECGKEVSDRAPSCPNCGCPIGISATPPAISDGKKEIEKYLDLALKAIQGQNSELVEKYCQSALEIDPENSKAWELEARGILFQSSLKDNKVPQAISAAANAVKYAAEGKDELANSLYVSICGTISRLIQNAYSMPALYAIQYVQQCMNYYGMAITEIPLSKEKLEAELAGFQKIDDDSKKAFVPKKRLLYASHAEKPSWAEQYRSMLKQRGRL